MVCTLCLLLALENNNLSRGLGGRTYVEAGNVIGYDDQGPVLASPPLTNPRLFASLFIHYCHEHEHQQPDVSIPSEYDDDDDDSQGRRLSG